MMLKLLVLGLAFISHWYKRTEYVLEHGVATVYYPGDGNCGRIKADGSRFRKTDSHIAHRTLPLGTSGYVCSIRTGLCVYTRVQDRGPYGATLPCNKRLTKTKGIGKPKLAKWGRVCYWLQTQVHLQRGWKYRGSFDLTRPVSKAIGHKPFERVVFFYEASHGNSRRRRQLHAPPLYASDR